MTRMTVELFAGVAVRKVVYNDPDGNELGYGGGPAEG